MILPRTPRESKRNRNPIVRGWRTFVFLAATFLFGVSQPSAFAGTVATYTFGQGWATFGLALPQGAATVGVKVGSFPTQTDVKNRWPDGSIRFAVVTASIPSAGSYAITSDETAPGSLLAPALPTASGAFLIGGVTYTATLPAVPSSDLWLSGPNVYEGRSVIAPISSANGSPHPFLRVIFDTRVYSDGVGRVDVTVENVLNLAAATTVTYNVTLTVNGNGAFTKTGVEHYYLTRWRKTFAVGAAPAAITPDIAPFNAAKALPPFLSLIRNQINVPTGPTYEILGPGALEPNMPAHSGRQEIAPYPDWAARYLVHREPQQRAFVLANGDLSGSWPIHMREAETGTPDGVGSERFISIDERPNFWLDVRAPGDPLWTTMAGSPLPIREYGSLTPGPGQSALIPDNAHQPSLAFVPYLLTGDRYYAEEMAFWAIYGMARTYPGDGTRSNTGVVANNEVRGFGWSLRNIADAAAYYPEASPVRAHLVEKVQNNLNWLDNYAAERFTPANPFKVLWQGHRPDGPQYIGLWEHTYVAIAIDRANQHGFTGGLPARDAIADLQLKLFTSDPDYPRFQGAPYIVAIGTANPGGGFTYFNSMAQIWAGTQGQERPFAGYYGPEARLNLMRAIQNGSPGAQDAYDYLFPFIGTTPFHCPSDGAQIPDLACRAGWALDFDSGTPTPPPPSPDAAQLITPTAGAVFSSSTQSFTWTAGTGVTAYKLDVGTVPGASNLYAGAETSTQSAVVTGLPVNGSTVWVRLSSRINGALQSNDYSFRSYTAPLPPPPPLDGTMLAFADGNNTVETPPFSTQDGDLLVAFVASSGPNGSPEIMRVVGGNLTWTLVARANAQNGVSEIWSASSPGALSNIRVTSSHTFSSTDQSLVVVAFRGAGGIGASAAASAANGGPFVSLESTRAGSLAYAVGNDWDGAVPRTLGPNQVMVHERLGGNGDTFWVQRLTNPTSAAGALVTMNDTAPTNHTWNFAAVEIIPAGKPVPVISWAAPAPIVYQTPLSATQLNATANVAGTFVYNPPAGDVRAAGVHTLSVIFNPTDTETYDPASATVSLTVTNAATTVTWNDPASVEQGTALGAAQLNASASVDGTFSYSPTAGTVLGAGTHVLSVTFTPTDPNYQTVTDTVTLNVSGTVTINWPPPAAITQGTPLGATQLNANAGVPGSYVYSPATGTVLPVGTHTLSVTFTPTDSVTFDPATATVSITVTAASATPSPVRIGSAIAGTFKDSTGHSGQSHLVFAPNAGVWWYFTVSSTHDSLSDHTVRSFYSSGPDLATATWTESTPSPHLANTNGATNSVFAGGRALGVALRTVGSVDYVHVFASAAFDGQNSSNGHIRAALGPAAITWSAWNNPGAPNTASEWDGPLGTGNSSAATKTSWGNSVGISTGGYIHHFSSVMDKQIDCNVGRSRDADTAATWANNFGSNTDPSLLNGTSPTWAMVVIDKTMTFQCKTLVFAPLASDVMLAVYSNGAVAQPNMTNLRFQRSGPLGTWTNIPGSGGGQGDVFSGSATTNHNDWSLVPVSTTAIYAFRPNAAGTAIQGRRYVVATNSWADMAAPPPAFGTGQAFKSGGGVFGATDGANLWLFFVNTNTSNSILYSKFNGTSWTTWAVVPGTDTGTNVRNFLAGYPRVAGNRIGLAWTTGTGSGPFNVDVISLALASDSPPAVSITSPIEGATVSGSVTISANASDDVGVAGVQFLVDGVALDAEDTIAPYSAVWNTALAAGAHVLTARARDTVGSITTSAPVNVTVPKVTPAISWSTPASIVYGTALSETQLNATSGGVAGSFAYSPAAGAVLSAGSHELSVTFTPSDSANYNAVSDTVTLTVTIATPVISWIAPAPIFYGTPLGSAQLNAAAVPAGTFVYTPAAGNVPLTGQHTLSVTFTPNDGANYTTATASVSLTVFQATPEVDWLNPADIVYGTPLGPTQLNATSPIPGTFEYSPAAGTVMDADADPQVLEVTFTPTDTVNYAVTMAGVELRVLRATPIITWPAPADIVAGTPLSAEQLNATSSAPGAFLYTPPLGTELVEGTHTLSATFTPTNPGNYTSANTSVSIRVTDPNRAPVLVNPGNQTNADRTDYGATVLADAPVAYWRLNESSGAAVGDKAGSTIGTAVGGVILGQLGALSDGTTAMRFDGATGSHVAIGNTPELAALHGATASTMEAWINPDASPSGYGIVFGFPKATASYFGVRSTAGVLKVIIALTINGVQRWISAGPALVAGTWYHIVGTYDGGRLKLYVNGAEVGQLTDLSGAQSFGFGGMLLGAYPTAGNNFRGSIDEAAIYNRALTSAEIAAHYDLRTSTGAPTSVTLPIAASDPDGDTLTYSATGLPPGLTIDPVIGVISGTLSLASVGAHTITINTFDGELTSEQAFTWTVTHVNRAPTLISPGTQVTGEGAAVSLSLTATDSDGDVLTFSATGLPASMMLDAATGLISGTWPFDSAGLYIVAIAVSDGVDVVGQTFTWTVTNTNRPPAIVKPGDQTTANRAEYAATVLADAPVAYWRLNESSGTTVADSVGMATGTVVSGVMLGQPGALADGSSALRFDAAGTRISIGNNPVLAALHGATASTLEAWINPDALPSGYGIVYGFPGATASYFGVRSTGGVLKVIVALRINGVQRWISAGPALAAGTWYHIVGTYDGAQLKLYVDGNEVGQIAGLSGAQSFGTEGILLGAYPTAGNSFKGRIDEPAIYKRALTAAEVADHYAQRLATGAPTSVSLQIAATDPDGDSLSYTATDLPPGLDIDPASGLISGTLSVTSSGTHTVTVTASDGAIATMETFMWRVIHVNQAPSLLDPNDQIAAEGSPVSLQLTATDADADPLTFSATGLPSSLTLNPATGLISGTLSFTSAGVHSVVVSVTDAVAVVSQIFTLSVTDLNRAPVVVNPGGQTTADRVEYEDGVLAGAPVAYWRFNETSGSTVADSAGLNPGTVTGGVTFGQPGALVDGTTAMRFDGLTGTRIAIGNNPVLAALHGATASTLEAWIKPDALPSGYGIVYGFPGATASYFGVRSTGGVLKVIVALTINGVQRWISAGPALAAGTWYHVVGTYDGAQLKLYVDGNEVGRIAGLSGAQSFGTGGILLGAYPTAGNSFKGLIDEPAIYNRALTPTEVATHYGLRTATGAATTVALQLSATDPDGDALTFSPPTGLPPGLTLNTATGLISGTLSLESIGTYTVTITVSDGQLSSQQTFTWTVTHAGSS